MQHIARAPRAVGWGSGLLAGIGAGIIAALACVVLHRLLREPLPPTLATAWSSFLAGIIGGLLYGWLTRVTRHAVSALWIITLAIATADSLLIALVPLAAGPNPRTGIPIYGLTVPLRQLAALIGIGRLGTRHFPAASLLNDTVAHYVTAVAVSVLVPWWSGRRPA